MCSPHTEGDTDPHGDFKKDPWMNKFRGTRLKFGALALGLAALAGFGGGPAHAQDRPAGATATATVPIKLALIESLSGPFANTGEAVFRNLL